MISRGLLFLFVFIAAGFFLSAQRDMNLFAARKLSQKGLYYEAREKYEAALAANPGNEEANIEYADLLFFYLADYENAYAPVLKSIKPGTDTSFLHFYCMAKCEQFLERYDLAELHYNKVLSMTGRKKKFKEMRTEVEVNMRSIEFAKKNSANSNVTRMRVVNAGKNVNTQYEEYVPVVDEKENFLLFTSRRKNKINHTPEEDEDRYAEDMYVAKRDGNNFTPAELLPAGFNSTQQIQNSGRNESLVSLSPDGNTLFLYKEGTLWRSDFNEGKWNLPVLVDQAIIGDDYENHISITADGKTVYFTGERKDCYGGTDIYRCVKNENGSWSSPENLGKKFNTEGNEQSPFVSKDGRRMYFSSDKREGFGGYDIYVSEFDGKDWSEPRNMGLPVNSSADDIFFFPNDDASEGFLSSNRKGAVGGFDIFRFYYLDKPSFGKKGMGNTNESENISPDEFDDMIRNYSSDNTIGSLLFRINDSLIVRNVNEIRSLLKSVEKARVEVQIVYNCDTCFYRNEKHFSYVLNGGAVQPELTVPNENEFESAEVFFSSNSAVITEQFASALDEIAEWLNAHPDAAVSLYGYADAKGNDRYNKLLSEKRAEAVAKYLLSKQISAGRIVEKEGRGEVDGKNPAHSRRVDIEVITAKLAHRCVQ